MNIDLAMLALNGISALSASLQLYRQYSKEGKEISIAELESLIQPATATEEDARHFAYIISDDLLGNIVSNINDSKKSLNDSVKSKKSHAERLKDADEVSRDICFELNFIKKHNEGVLPNIDHPNLYDLWLEHGCR